MQVTKIKTNDLKNEISISINDQEVFSGSSQETLFWLLRYRDTADAEVRFEIDMQILMIYGFNSKYNCDQVTARQPQLAAA